MVYLAEGSGNIFNTLLNSTSVIAFSILGLILVIGSIFFGWKIHSGKGTIKEFAIFVIAMLIIASIVGVAVNFSSIGKGLGNTAKTAITKTGDTVNDVVNGSVDGGGSSSSDK